MKINNITLLSATLIAFLSLQAIKVSDTTPEKYIILNELDTSNWLLYDSLNFKDKPMKTYYGNSADSIFLLLRNNNCTVEFSDRFSYPIIHFQLSGVKYYIYSMSDDYLEYSIAGFGDTTRDWANSMILRQFFEISSPNAIKYANSNQGIILWRKEQKEKDQYVLEREIIKYNSNKKSSE